MSDAHRSPRLASRQLWMQPRNVSAIRTYGVLAVYQQARSKHTIVALVDFPAHPSQQEACSGKVCSQGLRHHSVDRSDRSCLYRPSAHHMNERRRNKIRQVWLGPLFNQIANFRPIACGLLAVVPPADNPLKHQGA